MENKTIWNDFCFKINKAKNHPEKTIQPIVEEFFGRLNWSFAAGEIKSQDKIQKGSTSTKTDITIKNNGKAIIVIEIKISTIAGKSAKSQLLYYMHGYEPKPKFGIFIGENLQFYYYDNGDLVRVFETNFSENKEEAIEFISLIAKPFDEDKMLDFCKNEERVEKLKTEIHEGSFNNKVKDLFIEFLKKEYNEQIANKINNEIEVNFSLGHKSVICKEIITREREELFTFSKVGIKPGMKLIFTEDHRKESTVIESEDDRTVLYEKKEYKLAPLAQKLRKNNASVRGIRFFKLKDDEETLEDRFNRMRK
jgi:hypothetical protein